MSLAIVVLAAGKGTRMRSSLPKVLHPLGGKPLLHHVLDTARSFEPDEIVVVAGHGADEVKEKTPGADLTWVIQETPQGTAHAVSMAVPHLCADSVVVLYGDVPLISRETLSRVIAKLKADAMVVLTFTTPDPNGYGRIIRADDGFVERIVEHKDANHHELLVDECNSGIIGMHRAALIELLAKVENDNSQGEFYLTDTIALFRKYVGQVVPVSTANKEEVLGVNTKSQLADLERFYQLRQAEALLEKGLILSDKHRFDLRGQVTKLGQDCFIDINCVLEGTIELGDNVKIGPNCQLVDCSIADNATIHANTVVERARVGANANVGPFARLRPGTDLGAGTKVGNFVETKNAQVANDSKINHLSYVGDTEMGSHVNVGAGTITCNYDGANKHKTTIGDNVFVGSNSALVAPVSVGDGATIAAGSTITQDVGANKLVVARSRQSTIDGWNRPKKGK